MACNLECGMQNACFQSNMHKHSCNNDRSSGWNLRNDQKYFCRRVEKVLISCKDSVPQDINQWLAGPEERNGRWDFYLMSTVCHVRWNQTKLCYIKYSPALNVSGDQQLPMEIRELFPLILILTPKACVYAVLTWWTLVTGLTQVFYSLFCLEECHLN